MNSALLSFTDIVRHDLRVVLRQIGQIHFQRSTLTGAAILLALALVNPWAAAGALYASVLAVGVARVARMSRRHFRQGLYGYNAALTGAGYLSFFAPGPEVFALLGAVSVATVLLTGVWLRFCRLPALTIQFVVAMWLALGMENVLGLPLGPPGCANNWASIFCSVGQITFVSGVGPSLMLLLAFARHSREETAWLAWGATMAWAVSEVVQAGLPQWAPAGMALGMAVNVALVGQGLTVFGLPVHWRHAGIALCMPLCLLFSMLELPYFTLPFCLTVWAILEIERWRSARISAAG
jgi:urea transporter